MLSEEATPGDWCIVTESGAAYLVVDYTRDPLGMDGFRIQPLHYRGKNRFAGGDHDVVLEPWSGD